MLYCLNGHMDLEILSRSTTDHLYKVADIDYNKIVKYKETNEPVTFLVNHIDLQTDFILNEVENRIRKGLHSKIIFEYAYEAGLGYDDVENFTKKLLSKNISPSNVIFILNNSAEKLLDKKEVFNGYDQVYFIDYFALVCSRRMRDGISKVSSVPVYERGPVLNILLGKILHKKSRLEALYLLYKKGLADSAIKGLLVQRDHLIETQKDFTDQKFFKWLLNNIGPADFVNFIVDNSDDKTLLSTGYPYDVEIYNKSRVSYVCETACIERMQPASFITEKTYRPILNKSPFVLQGCQETLPYLKSLGYDVYDQFTGEYYIENDYHNYIEKTVEASHKLLSAIEKYPHEIEQIAEKNRLLFHELANKDYLLLRRVLGV